MTLFSSVLTAYSTKVNGQVIDASDVNNLQTDVTQIEAILGVDGASSVVGTYAYLVKSPASDGGGHVQVANKGGTGQTSFNKGDILVATSSSVISKLAVGSDNAVLQANSATASGVQWGAVPGNPTVRVYTSNATWPRASTLAYLVVEVQAAGGGGGYAITGNGAVGAGGGGGAYARKFYNASVLTGSVTVTVGSKGTGGTTGGSAATNGGNSSFGAPTSVLATGGGLGTGTNTPTTAAGGVGGVASGGDLNINGQTGGYVVGISATNRGGTGQGGNSFMGFGGPPTDAPGQDGAGYAATNYGGGGSGGFRASGNSAGGDGANGIVIVYEY